MLLLFGVLFAASSLILLSIAIFYICKQVQGATPVQPNQYEKNESLYSKEEKNFLTALNLALGGEYQVQGKVRLGDLVSPNGEMNKEQSSTAKYRIEREHVDYVICHPVTMEIVGVVEFDENLSRRHGVQERDYLVNQVLRVANIPIVHVAAAANYNVDVLRSRLIFEMGITFSKSAKRSPNRGAVPAT